MPTITTMNGFCQSVAATAPLDLRTTNRDRGGTGVSMRRTTPDDDKGHCGDSDTHATARAAASPTCRRTRADHIMGNRTTNSGQAALHREQLAGSLPPTIDPTLDTTHSVTTCAADERLETAVECEALCEEGLGHVAERLYRSALGSEHRDAAVRRTPSDNKSSSSRLPFRKRRFPADPAAIPRRPPAPPPDRGDRLLSPALNTGSVQRRSPPSCFSDDEERSVSAPPPGSLTRHLSGVRDYPAAGLVQQAYSPYLVYYWPHFPALHPAQTQEERLLADVTLATDQDEDGDTPLHIAVVQGEERMVHTLIHLLLLAHRDLDIYNNLRQTPLHLSVITQQPGMVEALLRAGADPGALDRNGQTALHLCCEYSQRDCLSAILSPSCAASSSCLEIRNYEGLSPLHLAVRGGHKDLARMLLDSRADINAMDIKSGQSPLMHAVESGNINMVHFLIEQNGCDVNGQSYSGNTALHAACGRGQVDTVRLLLKSGADSSLKNYHNDTPVMVAKNKMITDVLRGKGPKQTRSQDQHCLSSSSHGSNLTASGSPSPNHSLGRSPSSTPHSASLSPRGIHLHSQ